MATHFYNGEIFDIEIIHGRKDGSHLDQDKRPVLDSKGTVTQYFAMVEDITDKRKLILDLLSQRTDYLS
jgi:hypothetical protein